MFPVPAEGRVSQSYSPLKKLSVFAASEPKRSPTPSSAPALLVPWHLSKPQAPSLLVWRRVEGEGRGPAVSSPAIWHSPAGSPGSLPLHLFSSRIHQLPFLTLSGSWPPTSAPAWPPIGLPSENKCFLSHIVEPLGTNVPAIR